MRRIAATLAMILISTILVGVPSPASAATTGLSVSHATVAVETSGGKRVVYVPARCLGTKTCTGRVALRGSDVASVAYSMKGKKSGFLTVPWSSDSAKQPTGVGGSGVIEAPLVVTPKGRAAFTRTMTLERRISSRAIGGAVRGPGVTSLRDLEVSVWTVSGLQSRRVRTVDVAPDGTFELGTSRLGRNNAPGPAYRLSVSALVDGTVQEWFWRGSPDGSGLSDGGGGWIRDAGVVRVQKARNFVANFDYGTISGRLTGNGVANADADVRVLAPPASYPSRTSDRRGLDVPYCANEFGRTRTDGNGNYDIPFVPRAAGTKRRYMVDFEPSGSSRGAVIVSGGDVVDSCQAALGYKRSMTRLLGFRSGELTIDVGNVSTNADIHRLRVDATTVKGGTSHDRWTTLREYTAGRKVLDSPVVAEGYANSAGVEDFDVRPGKYWVEVGRRTSCSAWYPSLFPNNYLYHKGGERAGERWKTVSGSKAEYYKSVQHGFPRAGRKPPRGYKGWMYRDVCKAVGTGRHVVVTVSGTRTIKVTNAKGGTISGRVSRAGGKTNKEMLVTAYSTDGTKVLRSAYTGKSGGFVIRGLASGSYKIVVNADSWRGISRTFTGKHTVKAKAGKNSSAGTLRFKG